jgi:predicted GIY-YIG superfamily endonuclease
VDISSALLAIECADQHCYIFATQDMSKAISHHLQGSGSPFTVKHKPTGKVTARMFETDLQSTARVMAEEYATHGWIVQNEFELSADELVSVYHMQLQPVRVLNRWGWARRSVPFA